MAKAKSKSKPKAKENPKPTHKGAGFEFPLKEDLNSQAFLLEWRGFKGIGTSFCVEYAHGTGIFSAETIATHRMEWVSWSEEKGWQKTKKFKYFEPVLEMFMKKGAKVALIDIEEAKAIRLRIQKDPKSFAPKTEEKEIEKRVQEKLKPEPLPHEKAESAEAHIEISGESGSTDK